VASADSTAKNPADHSSARARVVSAPCEDACDPGDLPQERGLADADEHDEHDEHTVRAAGPVEGVEEDARLAVSSKQESDVHGEAPVRPTAPPRDGR
jgi:hypothetical protein